MSETLTPEESALLWTFDRLSVDNLSKKEIEDTRREIGKVILGRASVASRYQPNDWDDCARLIQTQELPMDAKVSDMITEEVADAYWDAFDSIHGSDATPKARAGLEAVIPLIAAQVEAATIERCAKVAFPHSEYAAPGDRTGMVPGSPYDRGRFDAATAIRSLSEGEKG